MKKIMNITTCAEDLTRYRDNADLVHFYRQFGLDGLEVLQAGEDERNVIAPENVIGVHLRYYSAWMDLWKENDERLLAEYGDRETVARVFGGLTKQALSEAYRVNLKFALPQKPEYLVFHVSECTLAESMLRRYHYTDEEVIDAAADLVNEWTDSIEGQPWLLFENLWYSGLTMQKPELIPRLLERVSHPRTGVMLDIGHLLHTNPALRSMDQAIDYIYETLAGFGNDLSFIRGVHLHQTLSGKYAQYLMQHWRPGTGDYQEKLWTLLPDIFKIDSHQPFLSPRLSQLLEMISPDYLVYEFISADREQHAACLRKQAECLRSLS